MKKAIFALVFALLMLSSCRKTSENNNDSILKLNDGTEYTYSDFALYDSSTHIFYFRDERPDFKTDKATSFKVLAYGSEIYTGTFWPPYSSTLPVGPYIDSFLSLYHDFAFRMNFMSVDNKPLDPRNATPLILAMRDHNILHSGLSLDINSVVRSNSMITLKFTVTNLDTDNLLIIDPEKTGMALFHYFTNGLYIRDLNYNEIFSNGVEAQTPVPWDSWNINWLSGLNAGESKQFTLEYKLNSIPVPGEYIVSFQFPGLQFQVTKDQLYQPGGRLWLGNVEATKRILIQ
jgi:hypothetical protein